MSRFFWIKKKGFNYNDKKSARCFFVTKKKDFVLCEGPFSDDAKNVSKFKKSHKNVYEKKGKLYAKEKVSFSLKEFINKWKTKNKKKLKEMSISEVKII